MVPIDVLCEPPYFVLQILNQELNQIIVPQNLYDLLDASGSMGVFAEPYRVILHALNNLYHFVMIIVKR